MVYIYIYTYTYTIYTYFCDLYTNFGEKKLSLRDKLGINLMGDFIEIIQYGRHFQNS